MGNKSHEKLVRFVHRSDDLFINGGPSMKRIYEMCVEDPRPKAVSYFDEDERLIGYNYGKYREYAELYARRLTALLEDIPYGEPVGLKMKNGHLWPYLFWGILGSGHAPLLLDSRLEKEKTAVLLREAGAKALIANEEEEYEVPRYRLRDLGSRGEKEIGKWADEVYLCTSGTTGNSRIMIFTGEDFSYQIKAAYDVPDINPYLMSLGSVNILAMIPLHHIFGLVAVLLWFTFYHKNLVYPSSIGSKDLINAIKKGKCTHVFSVPMLFDSVSSLVNRSMEQKGGKILELYKKMSAYNRGEISKKEAGALASSRFFNDLVKNKVVGTSPVFMISGGGYLSEETMKTITGLGYPLYNGIGMTEVGVTSVELSTDPKVRLKCSVGKPFHGVEYKIADDGELLIRSHYIHKKEIVGGRLQITPLEEGGYFRTGDLVEQDETGRIYVRGRLKETIINSNGENVYPDELEDHFKTLKGASAISVMGIPEKGSKEEDIALVYEPGAGYDEEAFKKQFEELNSKLNSERRISRLYKALKPLPLANGIKVKRLQVAKEISSGSPDFVDVYRSSTESKTALKSLEKFDKAEVERLLEGIKSLFAKTLVLDPKSIRADSNFGTDLGGDSMSYVAMVADLNGKFGIELPEEQYGKLLTPADFALYLLERK